MHEFQEVERIAPAPDGKRHENDAEHSYTLTMLSWYLIDTLKLDLDKELVTKYSLIHDLVEVHAGDTYIFEKDRSGKEKREAEARATLARDFPDFKDLHIFIEQYEKREDKESKFVYALDKIAPMITIYLNRDGNETWWQKHGVTLSALREYKDEKAALSPELNTLYENLIDLFEKEKEILFPTETNRL